MSTSNWSSINSLTTKASYVPTTEEAILNANDKAAYDLFGNSIALTTDGSRCIVGAYNADPGGTANAGKAYIFTRSGITWTQSAVLVISTRSDNDRCFTTAMSGDGSRAAYSSIYKDFTSYADAGAVGVFA